MNRYRINEELRNRLWKMTSAEINELAIALLDHARTNSKILAEATGRPHKDVLVEWLVTGAVRRPTDLAWLRVVIPQAAPELAPGLAGYLSGEDFATPPKKRPADDYFADACQRRDDTEDHWNAAKKRGDKIYELVLWAEWYAGGNILGQLDPQQAAADEQLLEAICQIMVSLSTPDASAAEPYDAPPIWGSNGPCGFDGFHRQTVAGSGEEAIEAPSLSRDIGADASEL